MYTNFLQRKLEITIQFIEWWTGPACMPEYARRSHSTRTISKLINISGTDKYGTSIKTDKDFPCGRSWAYLPEVPFTNIDMPYSRYLWIITSQVKCTVEVFELISNFTLHILMDVITYSCWDGNQSILVRGHGDIHYITSKTTPTIARYVGESHVWQLGSIDGCHAPYVIGLLSVSTLCCLTEKIYCELTWVLQSFKSQTTRLFVH